MRILYVHGAGGSEQSFNWIHKCLPEHTAVFFNYSVKESISATINRLVPLIDRPTVLLGHSLGGIITATCAELPEVQKLITLCAPFGGVPHAELLSMFSYESLFRDLCFHSPLLTALRSKTILIPHLAIVANSGMPLLKEPNDGVLTVSSQTAIDMTYEMLPLNHFEVLLSMKVVELITDFLN